MDQLRGLEGEPADEGKAAGHHVSRPVGPDRAGDDWAGYLDKGDVMSFGDIPEDRERSYPCPMEGCDGDVKQDPEQGMMWQCDKCNWMPEVNE